MERRRTVESDRVESLRNAFRADGFDIDEVITRQLPDGEERIGIVAKHQTAVIGTTGEKKKAFYVEGDPYTMGYLMGRLAEPDIERMCTEFNENIVFDFLHVEIKDKVLRELLGKLLTDIINWLSRNIYQDFPEQYKLELQGMLAGCQEANPKTKVDEKQLWILNVGIDGLLAFIYTGKLPLDVAELYKDVDLELKPEYFRIPVMCNGYAQFGIGNNGKPYHYMGRDFMFPTAGVFEYTAAMIIYNPAEGHPFVTVSAPGMIGSIAGMNQSGVGVGVDMSPSGNCDSDRPGLNSLLLNRLAIQEGASAEEAVDVMVNTQRGVSWDYILADGTNDRACIVEAGMSTDQIDFMSYLPNHLAEGILKPVAELLKNPSTEIRNGLMVRWNNYQYPEVYNDAFNPQLVEDYKRLHPGYNYQYNADDFGETGFINSTYTGENCPKGYYFAPQREQRDDLVLVSNHYVIPEMRLCAMNWWTQIISAAEYNDIQWRYDQLNKELLDALAQGPLDADKALEIIDFLAPYGQFPDYYFQYWEKDKKPLDECAIQGSVSLMDLKELTIINHYGFYSDEWVTISLSRYLD